MSAYGRRERWVGVRKMEMKAGEKEVNEVGRGREEQKSEKKQEMRGMKRREDTKKEGGEGGRGRSEGSTRGDRDPSKRKGQEKGGGGEVRGNLKSFRPGGFLPLEGRSSRTRTSPSSPFSFLPSPSSPRPPSAVPLATCPQEMGKLRREVRRRERR